MQKKIHSGGVSFFGSMPFLYGSGIVSDNFSLPLPARKKTILTL
jgi:hypothetical protein